MNKSFEEKIFIFGMYWRMVYGGLRIILGLALLNLVGVPIIEIITKIMSHELIEDPRDLLYVFANTFVPTQTRISYFLAGYLIFWGLIDTLLSFSLVKKKVWAFPVSLILIGGFIIYELLRLNYSHSLMLLWVIIFDIFILWLIKREYVRIKNTINV